MPRSPHTPKAPRRARPRVRIAPGSSPGTITTDPDHPKPRIRLIAYSPTELIEREVTNVNQLEQLTDTWPVVWVDVQGLGDAAVLERLGQMFGFHPLALEDVAHTHQRPKVERYPEHLYVVARMPVTAGVHETEQFSMFLRDRLLVTFQEQPGDCFDPVRQRLRGGRPLIRTSGPDYLMYALLDSLVDSYFGVLENLGEELDGLQTEALGPASPQTLERIQRIRSRLRSLRRDAWPLRDMLSALAHEEGMTAQTRLYLRDCHDHAVLVIDLLETHRELASNLVELYMSAASNRLNEVMKILTMIATIFMPLGFIAGVYGMNFDTGASPWNMPELGWRLGYPFALLLMGGTAAALLLYFKRKGWFR